MADHAIDKTTNSTSNLIQAQSINCQEAVANAWITGITIIADAVCVCLNKMNKLEHNLDDFIRLEYSWSCIQSSVDASISALSVIFSLIALTNSQNVVVPGQGRNLSISSITSDFPSGEPSPRSRDSSTVSAFGFIKHALSHGNIQPPPVSRSARSGSVAFFEPCSRGFRASMSAAVPMKISIFGTHHPHTILTAIPFTPAVVEARRATESTLIC